jgi:2-oxoglutarate dehydrogenase complex dehydrogenase (E1) component-like enzyme
MALSRVPALPNNIPIVDPQTGQPTEAFRRYWQESIQQQVNALIAVANTQAATDAATAAAAAAASAAATAQTAADTANTAAVSASTVAEQVAADNTLANSYVTGLTLTATDAGASATVTISAHTRVYGDGTSVAVSGGSVTGLAYSTAHWVYYDQASRAGGAVTYAASTSVQGNGTAPDRHLVGAVTTPAAAAAPNTGNPARPPGFAQP